MLKILKVLFTSVMLVLCSAFSNDEAIKTTTENRDSYVEVRQGLFFYPSPFSDSLNIHSDYKIHIRVMNHAGKEIKNTTLEGEKALYNDLEAGIYILKFFTPFGTYYKRVEKE